MNKKNRWEILSMTLFAITLLSACAGNKAEPSDEFLAPISDQTVDLIGDVEFGLQLADSVQLNHYFDGESPKVDAWAARWDDLQSAMRSIVYFSADQVDIAEAAEGPDAIEPLITITSRLASELRALPSAQPFLGDLDLQAMFQSMREQDDITNAIHVAQPALSGISDIIGEMLGASDTALIEAVAEVFDLINATHAPMLAYGENLTARQNAALRQLDIMDRVWSGDDSAWTELLASDWVIASELGKNSRLSPATAKQAEKLLVRRLESVATIRQHLEPAMIAYRNELQELYQIEEHSEAMLRVALLIIESWDKAQALLASGEKGALSRFTSNIMKIVYSRALRK